VLCIAVEDRDYPSIGSAATAAFGVDRGLRVVAMGEEDGGVM
jgi:hypothetical protein